MLTSAFLVLAAAMMGQADQPLSNYEHLKDLEYFVGTWNVEGEIRIEGEFAGLSDVAGRPLRQQMSYEWFKNKNFLSVTMREDAKSSPVYLQVIGWDPERKRITSTDFNAEGAHLKYVHIKKDNGWVIEGTSVFPGNAEGVFRGEIKIIDDKTFREEGTGVMRQGGKESKVRLFIVAKRQ